MKKIVWIGMIAAMAGLLGASTALAVSLSFSPSSQIVPYGSSFTVDVVISGLGDFSDPSVGAFDLGLFYNPTYLTATGVTFGGLLGDPGLGEATTSFDISTPGLVDLSETSLLENDSGTCVSCVPPYLEDLQPASFVLATLSFDAVYLGVSFVAFNSSSPNEVTDGFGAPISTMLGSGSMVESVPEPASLLLLMSGLTGILRHRRRRRVCSKHQGI